MINRLGWGFCCAGSVLCLAAAGALAQTDVKVDGTVEFGGKSCDVKFLFDTGASQSIVSLDTAIRLGLVKDGKPVGNNGEKEFNGGELKTWCFDNVTLNATDSKGNKCPFKTTVYVSQKADDLSKDNILGVPWQTGADACYRAKGQSVLWPWEKPPPADPKKPATPKTDTKSGTIKKVFDVGFGYAGNKAVADMVYMSSPFSILPQSIAKELGAPVVGSVDLKSLSPEEYLLLSLSDQNLTLQSLFDVIEVDLFDLGIGPVGSLAKLLVSSDLNSDFGILGDDLLQGELNGATYLYSATEMSLYFNIPSPGVLTLLVGGALVAWRRRR